MPKYIPRINEVTLLKSYDLLLKAITDMPEKQELLTALNALRVSPSICTECRNHKKSTRELRLKLRLIIIITY